MKDRDRERSSSSSSRGKERAGVSFLPEDAVETGLFSSGPARIKESVFTDFDYGGNAKSVPVWLVTFERDGEEPYEQPYSLGKGWKVSKDGTELIPKMGQTGLPKSSNAMKYLITPLYEALKAADLDVADYITGNPTDIEGLEVVVARVAQEKRDFRDQKARKNREREDAPERSILIIEEVTEADSKSSSKKTSGKKKDEDDEPDEKPRRGKKDADADEDEADEDEKPKGKRGAKDEKDEDGADESELDEEAGEAIVAALEAEDGPIKFRDLADTLGDALKGNPQRKAIVAHVTEDFLDKETSWTFDGKTIDAKKRKR